MSSSGGPHRRAAGLLGRDGRRTQAMLHAICKSAYGGQDWVEVEPELVD